jgi:hypothetical protein
VTCAVTLRAYDAAMTVRLVDPPPAAPKIVVPLWTVTRNGQRIDAELVDQGAAGFELWLLRDREWFAGRRFGNRAQAVAHSVETRRELLSRGWNPTASGALQPRSPVPAV